MDSAVKERLDSYAKMLPVAISIGFTEAERRAGDFLSALAFITDLRHIINEEKIRALSVLNAVYAEELAKGTAKTITENKVTVEASNRYRKSREELEYTDGDLTYLKAYYDIFMAAHVFYRQMAKGENV